MADTTGGMAAIGKFLASNPGLTYGDVAGKGDPARMRALAKALNAQGGGGGVTRGAVARFLKEMESGGQADAPAAHATPGLRGDSLAEALGVRNYRPPIEDNSDPDHPITVFGPAIGPPRDATQRSWDTLQEFLREQGPAATRIAREHVEADTPRPPIPENSGFIRDENGEKVLTDGMDLGQLINSYAEANKATVAQWNADHPTLPAASMDQVRQYQNAPVETLSQMAALGAKAQGSGEKGPATPEEKVAAKREQKRLEAAATPAGQLKAAFESDREGAIAAMLDKGPLPGNKSDRITEVNARLTDIFGDMKSDALDVAEVTAFENASLEIAKELAEDPEGMGLHLTGNWSTVPNKWERPTAPAAPSAEEVAAAGFGDPGAPRDESGDLTGPTLRPGDAPTGFGPESSGAPTARGVYDGDVAQWPKSAKEGVALVETHPSVKPEDIDAAKRKIAAILRGPGTDRQKDEAIAEFVAKADEKLSQRGAQ